MASNDDLMSFLKQMEEKREKEKEELAEVRKRERQEDRAEMIKLMETCIGEKVNELIEPYKERTERIEKGQSDMKEQVDILMGQMKSVNEILGGKNENLQSSSTVTMAEAVKRQRQILNPRPMQQDTGDYQEVKTQELISLSRRTVGLQKIDSSDIQRMYQEQYGGATSEEEARLLAVKEYLKLELKLSEETIQEMEIERIFTPAREDPEWLYVTFRYKVSVSRIFEKTRIMRKNGADLRQFVILVTSSGLRRTARQGSRWGTGTFSFIERKDPQASGNWCPCLQSSPLLISELLLRKHCQDLQPQADQGRIRAEVIKEVENLQVVLVRVQPKLLGVRGVMAMVENQILTVMKRLKQQSLSMTQQGRL